MTDLTIFDAEVVPVISMEDAVALDQEIRNRVTSVNDEMLGLQELIDEAKRFELHTPLGFPSWTAYVADVFTISNELGREQRRELVSYLAGEGMSNRAIAQAVGADERTVRRDREQVRHDAAPDRPTITVDNTVIDSATGEVIREAPSAPAVTGLDGKTYPATPATPKTPRRKPITDAFDATTFELKKVVERAVRLTQDDRFTKNKDQISGANLSDLVRVRDAINGVIQHLEG